MYNRKMALCESQLDVIPVKRESSPGSESSKESPDKKPKMEPNGDLFVPGGLPLAVDYRSPVSHFVPPELAGYAAKSKAEPSIVTTPVAETTPVKRKRGRPRVDKTSPEYLANLAARKQAKEMAAVMNNRNDSGEKRKRGRPRVDKTSPEYLARKRARELEALERKAKREYKRRGAGAKVLKTTKILTRSRKLPPKKALKKVPQRVARKIGDKKVVIRRNTKLIRRKESAASSSAGETPRVKRKYTKRAPGANKDSPPAAERVKGKRGRPRKDANNHKPQQPKIRVRSNLMPDNNEPITLDSDDEPDLGSPSQASDSLSLDENLRALRHIHEKYANIDKDDLYEAHLLAAKFKKPDERAQDDDVLSVRSSEGRASVKDSDRVEKLEDSSGSDSDSSSSGSGSSSSGSSTTSSSSSSSSSSSDSESEPETRTDPNTHQPAEDDRSFGAWSYSGAVSSGSESDPERNAAAVPIPPRQDEISESENESPDKSFQCHICKKWYSTRVTLKIHRRSHQARGGGGGSRQRTRSSDRYECDCCDMTFNRREKLWDHKASAHRGAMTVRCEVCRKCFEDDAELAHHAATHSADDRAGRCTDCGSSFQRYEQLARHRLSCARADSGGSHACHQCGKRFTHAHSLTRHAHNHARQLYRCVVCKASFARADQLAQHLNSHLANYKRLKP
ncbi:zinc finger protein 37-like [Cydia amplana]|uniref:zinc finger protein 37-like n=1 Tax=Cydia amplana TaxID=1869771 RepID=UPI002FE522D5